MDKEGRTGMRGQRVTDGGFGEGERLRVATAARVINVTRITRLTDHVGTATLTRGHNYVL